MTRWLVVAGALLSMPAQEVEPPDAIFGLVASADTYAQDGVGPFGGATQLYVKANSPIRFTYLRFDLPETAGELTSARLRLFGNNTGSSYNATDSVRAVDDDSWTEASLTWSSRPQVGAVVSVADITQAQRYYEWDLTSYVAGKIGAGQRVISLAIAMDQPPPNAQPNIYHSRENSSGNAPLLVITTKAGPARTPSVWTEYVENPDRHPHLPNVSYAGYHYGEDPLPERRDDNLIVVEREAGADDTEAIRAALHQARDSGGGTVFFPNGEYRISGVLFVNSSDTVLRGESRYGVRLVFTRSLEGAYGPLRLSDGRSTWSWSGGMIWFAPPSNNTYLPPGAPAVVREGWNIGSQLASVTSEAQRGDRSLTVSDASQLRPGQFVVLRVNNAADLSLLKHLTGEGEWAEHFDWANTDAGSGPILPANLRVISVPIEIAAVDGNVVTFRQPLRIDIRAGWDVRVAALGNTIRESGIEDLTIEFERDYAWRVSPHHNREPGWNGPFFSNAIHCWVRNVTVLNPDTAFGVAATKNITFTNFLVGFTRPDMRAHHHSTTCRGSSHDNLWENFVVAAEPMHGINVESFSMGNVWSRGSMEFGTFDNHKRLPYENVRTEIVMDNTGNPGGTGGPEMGARFVHWNVLVRNGRRRAVAQPELMPHGALVGVRGAFAGSAVHPRFRDSRCVVDHAGGQAPEPPNLYEAQRQLRLLHP